jgi:hypothetical protein
MGRVAADAEAARDATDGAAAPSELPPLALEPSPVELRSQLVALVDSLPDVKQRLQVDAQPETNTEVAWQSQRRLPRRSVRGALAAVRAP